MVDNPWICGGSQGVFAYGVSEIALSKNVVFVKNRFPTNPWSISDLRRIPSALIKPRCLQIIAETSRECLSTNIVAAAARVEEKDPPFERIERWTTPLGEMVLEDNFEH